MLRGTFDLEMAERVAHGEPLAPQAVAGLLASLAGKSLVQVQAGPVVRYWLLETVRQFAAGQLALKPVFRPDGTVTAGNACPLNDGAAAVVVMSDVRAAELGITPLARIVSTAVSALSPETMGLGPVEATQRALARAGLTIGDIDLVEMNEAFAAQVVPSARRLGIDIGKLNVHGGAIAVGHPFGMTGARIATTLVHALQERDQQFGLETMCVGGGQGMAMVLERLS